MKRFLPDEQGFSVLEAIISIAVLAMISGFVLQMYIVSSRVNQRAQDMDSANAVAVSAVESLKAQPSLDNFAEWPVLSGSIMQTGGEGLFSAVKYFDDEWKQVSADDSAAFVLRLSVPSVAESTVPAGGVGALVGIRAEVLRLEEDGEVSLTEIETSKYFAY